MAFDLDEAFHDGISTLFCRRSKTSYAQGTQRDTECFTGGQ